MKLVIFEYASGGGFRGHRIPHSILCEGYSMLKTATDDFRSAGYDVVSMLDIRLSSFKDHLNADQVYDAKPGEFDRSLKELFSPSDLSLVIAPESDGALSNIVSMAKSCSSVINSSPDSIDLVSDKSGLFEVLSRNQIPTPKTRYLSVKDGFEAAVKVYSELSGMVIVKPVVGSGCESVSKVNNVDELSLYLKRMHSVDSNGRFMVQQYVEGVPVSVSLISNGRDAMPISLNRQFVSLSSPLDSSCYLGGFTPFSHPEKDVAFSLARRVAKLFSGLKGYLGVDMIISPSGPVVVEVNPRLTVSYVGLQKVSMTNLAQVMALSVKGGDITSSFEFEGVSSFSKIRSENIRRLGPDVNILPPTIDIDGEALEYTFALATGVNESEANAKLKYASNLSELVFGDDLSLKVLGWDIGGANIKAVFVDVSNERVVDCRTHVKYFPIWKSDLESLPQSLQDVSNILTKNGEVDLVSVSMTAELSDAFKTKEEGVKYILKCVKNVSGRLNPLVIDFNGELLDFKMAQKNPLSVSGANWAATAKVCSTIFKDCVLIDVGSTTTDIIAIRENNVSVSENTDMGRLSSGELVYTGVLRSNIPSIVSYIPIRERDTGVSSENFASTGDVHLILGNINRKEYTTETADGRGTSKRECFERLARVVCADSTMLTDSEIKEMASYIYSKQVDKISKGLEKLTRGFSFKKRQTLPIVVTGLGGQFLGAEAAFGLGFRKTFNLGSIVGVKDPQAIAAFSTAILAAASRGESIQWFTC